MAAADGGGAIGEVGHGDVDGARAAGVGLQYELEGDDLVTRSEQGHRGAVPHGVIPAARFQWVSKIVLEDLLAVVNGPDGS